MSDDYTEVQDDNLSLHLNLLEIKKINESYISEKSDQKEVKLVITSIERDHFLHPIFVFRSSSNNYILADGAKRIQALNQLGCNLVPIILLNENETRKDSWIKLFHSKAPSYKNLYKNIPPSQRKHIIHKQFDLLSIETLLEYQYRKDIIAIYKDTQNVHVFSFKDLKESNLKDKLQLMKIFDQVLDAESQDKSYTLVTKAAEDQFNFSSYLMIPPPSNSLELDLLVKFPELRRTKAFCIKPTMRLVHLPIPIEILKSSRSETVLLFKKVINAQIPYFHTISLKLSFSKSLDISWYYQILIIGSTQSFITDVSNSEKKLIQDLLEKVEPLNEKYERIIA